MMHRAMTTQDQFVRELFAALQLPKHTRAFEIRCAVDEAVIVRCEYFPEGIDGEIGARALLSEYELVRRPVGRGAAADPTVAIRLRRRPLPIRFWMSYRGWRRHLGIGAALRAAWCVSR